ncbi:hypothetical protein D3C78_1997950 [compost metagenome]
MAGVAAAIGYRRHSAIGRIGHLLRQAAECIGAQRQPSGGVELGARLLDTIEDTARGLAIQP